MGDCSRVTRKPEVIGSSVGLIPRNALVLSDLATLRVVGFPEAIQKRGSRRRLTISSKRASDPRHPDSELLRFEFTNHRQEMLNSCAHDEPGITSILRSNSDKRALLRFS